MRMRVNKPRQNNFGTAVNLDNGSLVLFDPSVPQSVFGLASRDDLATRAQHCAILNNAEFLQLFPSPRAPAISRLHRDKLADVKQQQRPAGTHSSDRKSTRLTPVTVKSRI